MADHKKIKLFYFDEHMTREINSLLKAYYPGFLYFIVHICFHIVQNFQLPMSAHVYNHLPQVVFYNFPKTNIEKFPPILDSDSHGFAFVRI